MRKQDKAIIDALQKALDLFPWDDEDDCETLNDAYAAIEDAMDKIRLRSETHK